MLVGSDAHDACAELLARTDVFLVRARGERVFLRLDSDGPALEAASEAGYRPYVSEDLYRLAKVPRGTPPPNLPPGLIVRPRRVQDDYPLFRLYTASTPVPVRASEGLTFREWQESTAARWCGARRIQDTVVFEADRPVAWLRMARTAQNRILAALTVQPDRHELADATLHMALAAASETSLALLIPTYWGTLSASAEATGFVYHGTYTSLVHQVRERIMEGAFLPARI